LISCKVNQCDFIEFLFHFFNAIVATDFVCEKKFFSTGFPHHKFILWKTCGLDLQILFVGQAVSGN